VVDHVIERVRLVAKGWHRRRGSRGCSRCRRRSRPGCASSKAPRPCPKCGTSRSTPRRAGHAGGAGNSDHEPLWFRHANHHAGLCTGRRGRLIQRDSTISRSQSLLSATFSEDAHEQRGPHRSAQGQARFP
jgi:hypothetical protein